MKIFQDNYIVTPQIYTQKRSQNSYKNTKKDLNSKFIFKNEMKCAQICV